MTATIVNLEKAGEASTGTKALKGTSAKKKVSTVQPETQDPREIYRDLCVQEQLAINAIRGLRKIKEELREDFEPESVPEQRKMTKDQFLRHIYSNLAQDLLATLSGMNVKATPHHIINPIAIRQDGTPGDGTRQITEFLYFPDHTSETPVNAKTIEEIPIDYVLFAEQAIGYTTVKLEFDVKGEPVTIIGKTICSGSDDYNGNLGLILSLKNAIEQIDARKIDSPINSLGRVIAGFQDMAAIHMLG
jgi:hypothetical protein